MPEVRAISRKVLITGATRGLGQAMVHRFLRSDCDVRGCGRTLSLIESLNASTPTPGAFVAVDVADSRAVDDWAASLSESGFIPDLVLNNAGIMNAVAPLWEVPPDEFSALVDVNLRGTFHVIRAFLPAMIEEGRGVVVNFSSGWGRSTSPEVAPYCATKWGIEGLTRALAEELPPGLAAIPLNPGVINTDMLRQCWPEGAHQHASPEQWAARAVPFLLRLGAAHNGQPLTVP